MDKFIMLSFSSALRALRMGKLDVTKLSFIVSSTAFPDVETAVREYGPDSITSAPKEHIELLFPKLVQPRLMWGLYCTHYYGDNKQIPSEATTPYEAYTEMCLWQETHMGWYTGSEGDFIKGLAHSSVKEEAT